MIKHLGTSSTYRTEYLAELRAMEKASFEGTEQGRERRRVTAG
jgi:hypothetical protein